MVKNHQEDKHLFEAFVEIVRQVEFVQIERLFSLKPASRSASSPITPQNTRAKKIKNFKSGKEISQGKFHN